MKTIILLAAIAAFSFTSFAQRASEAVVPGSSTNVTRLVSICPVYSDDSAVTLLGIKETLKLFTVLPDGSKVNETTRVRTWTADAITALPAPWTNSVGTVNANNAFKAQLQALWTRFDNHPELVVTTVKQPGILTVPE